MGLTQGDVKITIGVTGKGDTRVVKEAGKDVKDLGEKIGTSMKSSVAPVNKLREGFEQVRSNVGFLLGGAIALGAGIAALANEFSANSQAIKAWSEVQKEAAGAVAETSRLVEEIQIKLGKRQPKSDLEKLGDSLRDTWAHNQELIDKASGAIIAYEDRVEELKRLFGEFAPPTQKALKELAHLHTELNNLTDEQNKALRENIGLINEIKRAAGQGFRADLLGAGGKPFYEQFPAKNGATPPRSFGGNRKIAAPEGVDGDAFLDMMLEVMAEQEVSGGSGLGGKSSLYNGQSGEGSGGAGKSNMQMMAGDVRDFTAALSESLPGMEAFTGALSQISAMWGEYAETGKGAARATIMSVGAIAMAGAEQIKNERLRAGVLSIIHLGLGTALMFVPGMQQEAYGHLAGAAILGSVAIFGGSGGGGGSKRSEPTRSFNRSLSDRTSSGNSNVTINTGVYFGGLSGQETAAELHSMSRRGTGSGFVPRGA